MNTLIILGTNLVIGILILIAGWVLGNYAKATIKNINKLDGTLKTFLGGLAKYAIFILAIVTILQQFGMETASLLAVLGAAGLAIGLALQGTLSNVASGVMLLILRPFNVGDFISSGSVSGTVKSLGLFATELSTSENIYIFVPNSKLWNADIQNFSRNITRRQDIIFSISYNDDISKAFKTIEKAISKDDRISTKAGKAPEIMVTKLGESSVDITLRVWSTTSNSWTLKVETHKTVKEALDKAGITIPFPTRRLEMQDSGAIKPKNQKKTSTTKKAA